MRKGAGAGVAQGGAVAAPHTWETPGARSDPSMSRRITVRSSVSPRPQTGALAVHGSLRPLPSPMKASVWSGELRHVAGKSLLEIALPSSQTERSAGSGQRAATFSNTASQRRTRLSSAEIAARVASSHLERWQPHRFCSI